MFDKERTYTTRGQVTGHPPPVSITILLESEHGLVGVTEREVERLGGEVTDDVGSVTTPQGHNTLSSGSTTEAVHDTGVLAVETTGAKHLILFAIRLVLKVVDQSMRCKQSIAEKYFYPCFRAFAVPDRRLV